MSGAFVPRAGPSSATTEPERLSDDTADASKLDWVQLLFNNDDHSDEVLEHLRDLGSQDDHPHAYHRTTDLHLETLRTPPDIEDALRELVGAPASDALEAFIGDASAALPDARTVEVPSKHKKHKSKAAEPKERVVEVPHKKSAEPKAQVVDAVQAKKSKGRKKIVLPQTEWPAEFPNKYKAWYKAQARAGKKEQQKKAAPLESKGKDRKTNWKNILFGDMPVYKMLSKLPEIPGGHLMPGSNAWKTAVEERKKAEEAPPVVRTVHRPESLVPVVADGLLNGAPGPHEIRLPDTWVKQFEPTSVAVHSERFKEPVLGVGTARLASMPEQKVQFTALRRDTPETARALSMSMMLSGTGAVPLLIDVWEHPELTYMLTEPAEHNLRDVIKAFADKAKPGEHLYPPADKAIPIMADLLGSLVAFEKAHVVLRDLSEDNIFITDGGKHALITDLHASCVDGSADGVLSCAGEDGKLLGSAWRQPPEMLHLHEGMHGAASNVWQLGLVFGRMMFGSRLLSMGSVLQRYPDIKFDDKTAEGRAAIRTAVQASMNVHQQPGYLRLRSKHPQLLKVLEGMLEVDPAKRWSAAQALEGLKLAAQAEGVTIPARRDPHALVESWRGAWKQ